MAANGPMLVKGGDEEDKVEGKLEDKSMLLALGGAVDCALGYSGDAVTGVGEVKPAIKVELQLELDAEDPAEVGITPLE